MLVICYIFAFSHFPAYKQSSLMSDLLRLHQMVVDLHFALIAFHRDLLIICSLEEKVSLNPVYSEMGKHIVAYNPCKTNHYFTEVATLSFFVGY